VKAIHRRWELYKFGALVVVLRMRVRRARGLGGIGVFVAAHGGATLGEAGPGRPGFGPAAVLHATC